MRILVTGACGFLGSTFIKLALEQNHQVTGFSAFSNSKHKQRLYTQYENPNLTTIQGDITDPKQTQNLCQDIDVVVHLEESRSNLLVETNVLGTNNLLAAADRNNPNLFLYVSSDQVYGHTYKGLNDEETTLNPDTPYASSKAASEMLCMSSRFPYIIARTEDAYGPYESPASKDITYWIYQSLSGQQTTIIHPIFRSRLHSQDLCRALLLLIQNGNPGEIYNVGNQEEYSDKETVNLIKDITNSELSTWPICEVAIPRRYTVDVNKMRELGWKPQFSLKDGLEQTITWWKLNDWWWS